MLTRFDHAVIAVPSLEDAQRYWRNSLGFDVRLGGSHTGRGTHNAIVRFGLDYLELISIYDRGEVETRQEDNALALARQLDTRGGGLIGFALASDGLQDDAVAIRQAGLRVLGPSPMERLRPDGVLLKWRLLVPAGGSWCRPRPFFIEWDMPDAERLAIDPPGSHENGAAGLSEIAIVVADPQESAQLYGQLPGVEAIGRDDVAGLAAHRARFRVGQTFIDLLAPTGAGEVAVALAEEGERPWQITISVRDLAVTAADLASRGITLAPAPGTADGRLLTPQQAFGTRLVFVQRPR